MRSLTLSSATISPAGRTIGLFALVAFLASALLVPAIAADEVELVFRKPEGQEKFDEGRKAFDAEEFKDAYTAFKAARKQAKDRPTKVAVDKWIQGSVGGNELVELRKRADGGRAAAAHTLAEKNYPKFIHTPIADKYREFIVKLEKDLFTMLENFDVASSRYSEKYGKSFIDDTDLVRQGKRCLKWDVNRQNFELKVKKMPRDLESFSESGALVFWLHFDKGSAPYNLIFAVPGKGTAERTGERVDNAYIKQMKPHKGWKKIEVPLKQFLGQGDVEWSRVRDFRIQFQGGRKFTCHVDAIMLRK